MSVVTRRTSDASQRLVSPACTVVVDDGAKSLQNTSPSDQVLGLKQRRKWMWVGGVAAVLLTVVLLGGPARSMATRENFENEPIVDLAEVDIPAHLAKRGTVSGRKGSASGAILPTGYDAWGNPLYPSSSSGASISSPAFTSNSALTCSPDPFKGGKSSYNVRSDRPVLIASASKWACLPKLISGDSYMASWHATIVKNATSFYNQKPVKYVLDGGLSGSGVLDPAREVQLRIYHWGYMWRMTKDKKWPARAYQELLVASGNSGQSFGKKGNNWNTGHFLDVGEFTAAFAYGYDWFYDAWTSSQKKMIRDAIVNLGLKYGLLAYTDPRGAAASYSWWTAAQGNWNCVCNSGLTLGALAILNDDTTGTASKLLRYTVPNAAANCAQAPSADGSWSETANYWYFGTYAHVRMAAALLSATGSTHSLMSSNNGMKSSGLYHMYVTGQQGLFAYGDNGPNKYTATANGMMFYGSQYNNPMYTLFQRDRLDAAEPFSMLYYDPRVTGQYWYKLYLDHYFPTKTDSWASMRSSWTDTKGTYIAMKASALTGHQAHGDLDVGDFVLDALGQRWAGEYGSGDYLAKNYFKSEAQDSDRWLYFRKRTEGQSTLVFEKNGQLLNQLVSAAPTNKFKSSATSQTSLSFVPPTSSTAFFVTDMSSAYGTAAMRAIRFINGRKQILIQDEVTVPNGQTVQWRMHTNATITVSERASLATLKLGGQVLTAKILSPAGARFSRDPAVRFSSDPSTPSGSPDQKNPGITILAITLPKGKQNIQVLFNPQKSGTKYITPKSVAISKWSLTSHG